eukprot:GHVO01051295.1.p1 GENE.GHVO01051295.1~~GHVO01051295.1.p1  ORF type:complete len:163 (-),score=53.45 GHVO01051295.1:475-963(-)
MYRIVHVCQTKDLTIVISPPTPPTPINSTPKHRCLLASMSPTPHISCPNPRPECQLRSPPHNNIPTTYTDKISTPPRNEGGPNYHPPLGHPLKLGQSPHPTKLGPPPMPLGHPPPENKTTNRGPSGGSRVGFQTPIPAKKTHPPTTPVETARCFGTAATELE